MFGHWTCSAVNFKGFGCQIQLHSAGCHELICTFIDEQTNLVLSEHFYLKPYFTILTSPMPFLTVRKSGVHPSKNPGRWLWWNSWSWRMGCRAERGTAFDSPLLVDETWLGGYHLVMTNIAMENPQNKWRFIAGKFIYKWAIFHGYVK